MLTSMDLLPLIATTRMGLSESLLIEVIHHPVDVNWRERNPSVPAKIRYIKESVAHDGPFDGNLMRVGECAAALESEVASAAAERAVSVTSRIWTANRQVIGHMPLMNLHPEGFNSLNQLVRAIRTVTNDRPGFIIKSGRYFHYYGAYVLSRTEWPKFLGEWLMPCVMVSPRYIGHSLNRGFCALRLNSAPPIKPFKPLVLREL